MSNKSLSTLSSQQIENCVIAIVWILILIWPMGIYYFMDGTKSNPIDITLLSNIYKYLVAFLILFILHNYVVIPYIYSRKKTWLSILVTILLLVGFGVFLKISQRSMHFRDNRPEMEMDEPGDISAASPEDFYDEDTYGLVPEDSPEGYYDGEMMDEEPGPRLGPQEHHHHRDRNMTPGIFLLTPPDMARMIIAILMIGANIGIRAILESNQQRKRLQTLEQQNLQQELDNLKHQINPHFFMNTLNNIHALIDIDQELAKRCVVELSQMMRYMLYDCTGSTVPLNREIEYLERYISLMKLRYDEKVEIVCQFNRDNASLQIPPLLLVTFVENAFKHGVSYREHSFIYVTMDVIDGGKFLHFSCTNSRHDTAPTEAKGGIGLENARKRLDLIYGSNYRLEVDTHDCTQYVVNLFLPTKIAALCPSNV